MKKEWSSHTTVDSAIASPILLRYTQSTARAAMYLYTDPLSSIVGFWKIECSAMRPDGINSQVSYAHGTTAVLAVLNRTQTAFIVLNDHDRTAPRMTAVLLQYTRFPRT